MLADVGLELTFPDGDAVPAHGSQLLLHLLVALPVAPDLADPELAVCLRNPTALRTLNSQLSTFNWWHSHPVSVPEASVHENTGPIFLLILLISNTHMYHRKILGDEYDHLHYLQVCRLSYLGEHVSLILDKH